MRVESAAVGMAVLLAGVAVFQLALAVGAPWGNMAYGGRAVSAPRSPLPRPYRVMSAVAVLVLVFAVWLVLARAGVASGGSFSDGILRWGPWGIFGYLILNTLANLSSSNNLERWVMGSVSLAAAALCLIVALNAPG